MSDLRDLIADAIAESQVGYSMSLIRLVDGVHTYHLTYDGGEKLEFVDDEASDATDKLYAHVAVKKRYAQADAVLAIVSGWASFQDRVSAAHGPLFDDDPTDLAERRDRFGEEANEAQQALGQTRDDAHRLVDYTYDRPAGEPEKEIGAAALTLASLCVVGGWDMMACAEADLAKLQQPETVARIRAKRSTRHGRGPLPGLSPLPNQG